MRYFTTVNTPKATHSRTQSPSFVLVNPSGCGDVYKEKLFQFLFIFVISFEMFCPYFCIIYGSYPDFDMSFQIAFGAFFC